MSTPTIMVFPGASLMDITPTSWGVTVRCPGCGNVQHFMTIPGGTVGNVHFIHEDECDVHARIQAAHARALSS